MDIPVASTATTVTGSPSPEFVIASMPRSAKATIHSLDRLRHRMVAPPTAIRYAARCSGSLRWPLDRVALPISRESARKHLGELVIRSMSSARRTDDLVADRVTGRRNRYAVAKSTPGGTVAFREQVATRIPPGGILRQRRSPAFHRPRRWSAQRQRFAPSTAPPHVGPARRSGDRASSRPAVEREMSSSRVGNAATGRRRVRRVVEIFTSTPSGPPRPSGAMPARSLRARRALLDHVARTAAGPCMSIGSIAPPSRAPSLRRCRRCRCPTSRRAPSGAHRGTQHRSTIESDGFSIANLALFSIRPFAATVVNGVARIVDMNDRWRLSLGRDPAGSVIDARACCRVEVRAAPP